MRNGIKLARRQPLVQVLSDFGELWSSFPSLRGSTISDIGYLADFLSERDEITQRYGSGHSIDTLPKCQKQLVRQAGC